MPALYAQEDVADTARENYESAIASGLYEEAEVAAKVRLDQAMRAGQVKELSTAELLNDLADAQRLSANYSAALQNYELAIEIVEAKRDMLNMALVEPVLGIGKTYLESGRADLALDYLKRALHVRSVNEGPHTVEQAEALELLALAYLQMEEFDDAADAADRLYLIYHRNYPRDSLQLVPALVRKGQILGMGGDRRSERNTYNEAVDIATSNDGESSEHLIAPYIRLGQSHQQEYFEKLVLAENEQEMPEPRLLGNAETYLQKALEISQSENLSDWNQRVDALLAMADFQTLSESHSQARVLYRDAWRILSENPAGHKRRRSELEVAVPLLRPPIDLSVALPYEARAKPEEFDFKTGFITAQYTITKRGRLTDFGLLEMQPRRFELVEAEIKRGLAAYVYRPRFSGGFAADTLNELARFQFPYLEADDVLSATP
jgi:tetratricopeptide (TPR) repeat protein